LFEKKYIYQSKLPLKVSKYRTSSRFTVHTKLFPLAL